VLVCEQKFGLNRPVYIGVLVLNHRGGGILTNLPLSRCKSQRLKRNHEGDKLRSGMNMNSDPVWVRGGSGWVGGY
jgi:hypothetical protein